MDAALFRRHLALGAALLVVSVVVVAGLRLSTPSEPHLFISFEMCPAGKVLTLPPVAQMSGSFLPLCDGQPLRTKYLVDDVRALSHGFPEKGMANWFDLGRYTYSGPP